MKSFLLMLFFTATLSADAQSARVNSLPAGTYEIQNQNGTSRFVSGDIILIDESHYKLSDETTAGDYKFSATAQRVLFISGTLKGVYAKATLIGSEPAIIFPSKENGEIGFKLVDTDVWAFFRKK